MNQRIVNLAAGGLLAAVLAVPAGAGITVYEDGDKTIEIGGRIQIQYARIDPEDGETTDRLFFRRLRPYIMGTVTKNWIGKIEFDFGESLDAEEVAIKDAYMLYTGVGSQKMYVGNSKAPFSREFLTSSKRLDLIARGFGGDHNFGSPDRMLGYKTDGHTAQKHVSYSLAAGAEQHDPGFNRMDFDTPINNAADWNEGLLVAGRVDFHPLGYMGFSQADFDRGSWKYTVGASSYYWVNDDDNNTYTLPDGTQDPANIDRPDLDNAVGYEISGAVRGRGLSLDIEIQKIQGETVVPDFTGGLYVDGETDLDIYGIQGGYMISGDRFELSFGWSSLDASNYEDSWSRTTVGFNYYLDRHNLKLQANHSWSENVFGVKGDDLTLTQVQMQFVF